VGNGVEDMSSSAGNSSSSSAASGGAGGATVVTPDLALSAVGIAPDTQSAAQVQEEIQNIVGSVNIEIAAAPGGSTPSAAEQSEAVPRAIREALSRVGIMVPAEASAAQAASLIARSRNAGGGGASAAPPVNLFPPTFGTDWIMHLVGLTKSRREGFYTTLKEKLRFFYGIPHSTFGGANTAYIPSSSTQLLQKIATMYDVGTRATDLTTASKDIELGRQRADIIRILGEKTRSYQRKQTELADAARMAASNAPVRLPISYQPLYLNTLSLVASLAFNEITREEVRKKVIECFNNYRRDQIKAAASSLGIDPGAANIAEASRTGWSGVAGVLGPLTTFVFGEPIMMSIREKESFITLLQTLYGEVPQELKNLCDELLRIINLEGTEPNISLREIRASGSREDIPMAEFSDLTNRGLRSLRELIGRINLTINPLRDTRAFEAIGLGSEELSLIMGLSQHTTGEAGAAAPPLSSGPRLNFRGLFSSGGLSSAGRAAAFGSDGGASAAASPFNIASSSSGSSKVKLGVKDKSTGPSASQRFQDQLLAAQEKRRAESVKRGGARRTRSKNRKSQKKARKVKVRKTRVQKKRSTRRI
jgi:hypothetical protein